MSVQEVINQFFKKNSAWSLLSFLSYRKGVDNFTYNKGKEHRLYISALNLLSEDDAHAQRCLLSYEMEVNEKNIVSFWLNNTQKQHSEDIINISDDESEDEKELDPKIIRSKIEARRKTSEYIADIHKQDLLRYNILDTINLSATKARELFKDTWYDMIAKFEAALKSDAKPVEDKENVKPEEVKVYTSNILKTTRTIKKLREVVKTARGELRSGENLRWKRRTLALAKVL
ncbi:hypothetical protein G9A89_013077 [Geosiphon pyriformis]|nr:hypothetical protein G9A89_013077 [Geosiphon pyriformis]